MRSAMGVTAVLWATAAGAVETEARALEVEAQAPRTFLGLSMLPLGPGGSIGLEAERAVGERFSVRMGVRAGLGLHSQDVSGRVSEYQNFQLAAAPGVRFFLTGRAPEGLWVGPNLELSRSWLTSKFDAVLADGSTSTFEATSSSWGVGGELMLGYTLVVKRGLTVQAGVGFGGGWSRSEPAGLLLPSGVALGSSDVQAPAEEQHVDRWDFRERVSLAVGWAF